MNISNGLVGNFLCILQRFRHMCTKSPKTGTILQLPKQ